jgi:CHASE2 domain-containing sensor protein
MKIRNRTVIKLLFACLITFGILAFVVLMSIAPGIKQGLSYANYGSRSMLFSLDFPLKILGFDFPIKNNTPHPDLVLVAIDNRTLKDKEFGGLGRWQDFKRPYYAKVVENLNAAGAEVIGIDVLFSEKAEGDEELAAALKKAGNVVLGMSYGNDDVLFPVPVLREAAHAIGYFQPYINE